MDLLILLLISAQLFSIGSTTPSQKVSVDAGSINITYWVIHTLQDATSGEAHCELNNGSLAYIPNDDALTVASDFLSSELGTGTFAYLGYTQASVGIITIRGTGNVQSWVDWDPGQPENGQECIVIYTLTGKFHDIRCNALLFALCSTQYEKESTTDVSTTTNDYRTTDSTDDVTTDATVGTSGNTTNTSTCHCDFGHRPIVIYPIVNISKELQAKLDTLKKETKVDEETLSSTIRMKTSASDPRPSSAYVGYLGIALLTMIFGGILLLDLPRLIIVLKSLC